MTDLRETMHDRVTGGAGFVAALDQSGGSTPKALAQYGIAASAYSNETEMFGLMHEMRVRIMRAPSFTGERVLSAILFERTMRGTADGTPVPAFLWSRGIVPFLKVDEGLLPERDGVSPMKPLTGLEARLAEAADLGVFGTKMRSTIRTASHEGIDAVVGQQFEIAAQIARQGLMPIVEPEVLIDSPDKDAAEAMLRDALLRRLDGLPEGVQVILKLTLPSDPGRYGDLLDHGRVARLLALSGGYPRAEACRRLAATPGMIASFSRALTEGLNVTMSDPEFDVALARSIAEIHAASTRKRVGD
ncbi:fructose bisphosphate aldolase [Reyranella sp.]|uniref:fructose bisphosphate aldolase n=1 Tax=Reyranella sp. TaxID=1929291 RepID=UPI003C7C9B7A